MGRKKKEPQNLDKNTERVIVQVPDITEEGCFSVPDYAIHYIQADMFLLYFLENTLISQREYKKMVKQFPHIFHMPENSIFRAYVKTR